ncbi:MAG: 50S ribosomal protein L25/general stress protein Ctc [Bacteroidales bacterium]|nr:50S ribosomal protein L25/general stress protein Ctc [Bacteroidales bacterium]MCK9498614.1 50S ribosomal protein L25/general stress protein Ctc [Bacteroidales bacterium]MDY0313640.1 50S ribosomal protein L25/general stress protein Ctc [Bacteroidales bacterium]NLB86234.1 50S ribosomal protein L25/general stress protein Ctc [Bacteroidales bacterium]
MKHFEIQASIRTELGKKATKTIRKGENIPCVIYGGEKNINFYTPFSAVRKLVYTPEVMLVDIKIDGKEYNCMIKEIQFHPVTDSILHIDFYQITPDKAIVIQIPLKTVGNSAGVKAGGKIKQNYRKITVKGLMEDIPDYFEVDITPLHIGESIRVRDLKSDKLEFIDPKGNIVVAVVTTRTVSDTGDEEDEEEGEGETENKEEEKTENAE